MYTFDESYQRPHHLIFYLSFFLLFLFLFLFLTFILPILQKKKKPNLFFSLLVIVTLPLTLTLPLCLYISPLLYILPLHFLRPSSFLYFNSSSPNFIFFINLISFLTFSPYHSYKIIVSTLCLSLSLYVYIYIFTFFWWDFVLSYNSD